MIRVDASNLTIVKMGGSLMGCPVLDDLLGTIVAAPTPVAIVPGGGVFADAVREAQRRLGFSDRLAHRLALDAMRAFAATLVERHSRLALARRGDFWSVLAGGCVPVWDASDIAAGHPDIPETWDVTADSLAVWLAIDIGAPALVLVKAAHPAALVEDALDAAFPDFAARLSTSPRLIGPDVAALAKVLAAGVDKTASCGTAEDRDG